MTSACRSRIKEAYKSCIELTMPSVPLMTHNGMTVRHGAKAADEFMHLVMNDTQRKLLDMLNAGADSDYINTATNHHFSLRWPDNKHRFHVKVHTDKPYPRIYDKFDTDDRELPADMLPPSWSTALLDAAAMRFHDQKRLKFAERFFDDFIPNQLDPHHFNPNSSYYVDTWDRKRHTLRMVQRDWPLLMTLAPAEYREKLGKRSYKLTPIHDEYESTWVPIIGEWVSAGMILYKGQVQTKKPPSPGVYINP